eukprot:COSAG04_NODE_1586_length_6232_cov_11.344367_7_plen_92_part_00
MTTGPSAPFSTGTTSALAVGSPLAHGTLAQSPIFVAELCKSLAASAAAAKLRCSAASCSSLAGVRLDEHARGLRRGAAVLRQLRKTVVRGL